MYAKSVYEKNTDTGFKILLIICDKRIRTVSVFSSIIRQNMNTILNAFLSPTIQMPIALKAFCKQHISLWNTYPLSQCLPKNLWGLSKHNTMSIPHLERCKKKGRRRAEEGLVHAAVFHSCSRVMSVSAVAAAEAAGALVSAN